MNGRNNSESIWRKVLIALTSSVITGVLLMLFIPSYIERNSIQPENMNNGTADAQQMDFKNMTETQPVRDNTMDLTQNGELDVTEVASKVMPSVVGISTSVVNPDNLFESNQQEAWSVGSGVIVSENGYILTNHHVVGSDPNKIIVTLANGKTINATSQWSDPTLDLAVIKINAKGLKAAALGDADRLRVGETAVAIGNPLGLQFQRTVTAGIVSAVNRTISISTDGRENYMEGLIQTDASINPGNSGGPLINSKGEVIGINTIKVTSAEGMGFAIPINITKPVITGFIDNGKYATPYMGLFAYDKVVAQYVTQDMDLSKGVYVAKVDPDSPVYKSGVRSGDIITHMGDVEVNTMMQLREEMFKCGPGSECTVTFIRDGKVRKAEFRLENRTDDGLITR
ncbi:trypsin-like peptidase domain-containing protein [Petroclostridium sp. X23]|uniref:S1C family serine protease n=1 Tax=Petroclostridium sp. X23 TaxID=3045146 RepID=UPI0024AE2A4A|nr:trypsin-like peptidase domain-containing protein [Petroclostridium sp. X23]WHH60245.1 trypsin-like peptidase domain-containing protein [Petroclostridium sp. X23]